MTYTPSRLPTQHTVFVRRADCVGVKNRTPTLRADASSPRLVPNPQSVSNPRLPYGRTSEGWSAARSSLSGVRSSKKKPPDESGGFLRDAGDGLLSRVLSNGVPSALQGLTTVFGMGTGVAPALQSPAISKMTLDCSSDRVMFESTVRSLGFLLVGSRC